MSKISARNRFQTISAIQSADWMIDPFWAMSNMGLIGLIEKNDVNYLPISHELSRENLLPVAFGLENYSITNPLKLDEAKPGSIMMMQVSGPMLRYGDWCSYGTEDYIEWLESAKDNPNIEGVLIRVNTPGGQVASVPHLHSLVSDFPKPIITWIDRDMMASAGVYAFIGADKVYASHRTDSVGSIGVYTRLRDVRAAMEKYGIKEHEIYAPQSTEKNQAVRQLFDEGKFDLLEEKLAFLADNFIEAVENARGEKLVEVEGIEWKKGRLLYAHQAEQIGLIDGIMSLDGAVNELVSLINQNKNNFSMFGDKHKNLTALQGVEAKDITEEQLNQVNANLDGMDVKGVRVVNAAWIKEAEDNSAALATAKASLATTQTTLATAIKERDEWKAKAEAFGAQPGDKPTNLKSKDEDKPVEEQGQVLGGTDKELAEFLARRGKR